jgi:Tfp pilus assembly protein PilO
VSARSQMIAAVAAVVVVLLAFYYFAIRSRQNELGLVRQDTQQERDLTQQLETELARREALQEDAPRLQAALDEMREFVPGDNQVANFIFQIQNAADQAGVGFLQITPELPKPPPEGARLAEVRTTIGAQGGYFAVQDFVRRLYDLDRAVRIDNLTMTGVEDDKEAADEGRVQLTLIARIFFGLPEGGATTSSGTTEPAPAPATSSP